MTAEADTAVTELVRKRVKPSLRTCIVTRAELPPSELIRFVPSPDGTITPDLARKLPGRGVWVTCSSARVDEAVAGKAFAKSLKRLVNVPADLPALVEQLMVKRVIEALSLANKAGLVVTGFAKVDAETGRGAIVALVHAAEAAPDGCGKLDRKWTAVAKDLGITPLIVNRLTIAQLDLATGRENVVHAALSAGGATSRFSIEAERLGRYRLHNSLPARASTAE
jgi:uncharacterized protein